MKVGDKVKYKTWEKQKQGRRKVDVQVTREGVIQKLYEVGGTPYADVLAGSFCDGGFTVVSVQKVSELEPAT